ncbi:MAG: Vitamin B12 dependent methionine synthase activation subunit [Clostridia bacterium]|nr:Vitamin B12 dependent methionine synthase activation subunit [Clostridia bacterium]
MSILVKTDGQKKAVWGVFDLTINGDICDLGAFAVRSRDLAAHLAGCRRVILFAATLGALFDRELQKQSKLSPHRAYLLQAQGTREIESFCDMLCAEFEKEQGAALRTRFSPGYGDLSLDVQREVFRVLEPARRIGLCLNDSMVMSPSKSVTAFVGVEK